MPVVERGIFFGLLPEYELICRGEVTGAVGVIIAASHLCVDKANNSKEPPSGIRMSSYQLNYRPAVFIEIISIQILSEFGVCVYIGNMTGTFFQKPSV
jgi:hypothetical protein